MGVAGTVYNYGQLKQLWLNAGGPANVADVMAAIALAESSGGASSTNSNTDGSTDYGLWQINSSNGATDALFDPNLNAQAAVRVYNQQGPGAWTTYSSGAYQQFMSTGTPASNTVPASTSTAAGATGQQALSLGSIVDPFHFFQGVEGDIGKGISKALVGILTPFLKIMVWGLETVVGIGIMIVAVAVMMQSSPDVRYAEKQVAEDATVAIEPETAPAIEAEKQVDKKKLEASKQKKELKQNQPPMLTLKEPSPDSSKNEPSRKAVSRRKREESYAE